MNDLSVLRTELGRDFENDNPERVGLVESQDGFGFEGSLEAI